MAAAIAEFIRLGKLPWQTRRRHCQKKKFHFITQYSLY